MSEVYLDGGGRRKSFDKEEEGVNLQSKRQLYASLRTPTTRLMREKRNPNHTPPPHFYHFCYLAPIGV